MLAIFATVAIVLSAPARAGDGCSVPTAKELEDHPAQSWPGGSRSLAMDGEDLLYKACDHKGNMEADFQLSKILLMLREARDETLGQGRTIRPPTNNRALAELERDRKTTGRMACRWVNQAFAEKIIDPHFGGPQASIARALVIRSTSNEIESPWLRKCMGAWVLGPLAEIEQENPGRDCSPTLQEMIHRVAYVESRCAGYPFDAETDRVHALIAHWGQTIVHASDPLVADAPAPVSDDQTRGAKGGIPVTSNPAPAPSGAATGVIEPTR